MKVYRIHPGIGIARVGRSNQGFFLASELPEGGAPFELDDHGDAPFTGYKDGGHLMRRQAVRFRVFEYEETAAGHVLQREITAAEAQIEWSVTLASRKAAGVIMNTSVRDEEGALVVTPGSGFRNDPPPGLSRADLVSSVTLAATGTNFEAEERPMAQFLGQPFYIGDVRTDAAGRLVVLAGMGEARTWRNPASDLTSFLNNRGWHDDIADGPVDAKVTPNGTQTAVDAVGAWVLTAPPDFAPDITPITTLYDVALNAHEGVQDTISYVTDIKPIFERVAGYHWINQAGDEQWSPMRDFLGEPEKLENTTEENKDHRLSVLDTVFEGEGVLIDFRLTKRQRDALERWGAGDFIAGADPNRPAPDAGQQLDRAALSRSVGGGFFPGIEAGVLMREPTLYSALCRLTRGQFTDFGSVSRTLHAGLLTERMACPWQADFVQCFTAWWPAQRPDVAHFTPQGAEQTRQWDRNVRVGNGSNHISRKNMVDHFARLGVIESMVVQGATVFGENGRDPAL